MAGNSKKSGSKSEADKPSKRVPALRLPPDVLQEVDEEAARIEARESFKPDRTQVVVALIRDGLKFREKQRPALPEPDSGSSKTA